MSNLKAHIVLIGFMGTGKSAVSKELANLLGCKVIDTDELIEKSSGMSISKIFAQKGEVYFRNLETQVLRDLLGNKGSIISCGGGLPLRKENQEIMKKLGKTILLTAKPENIYIRIKSDDQRPLLKNKMSVDYIENLMKKRQCEYNNAADYIISTDNKNILQICKEIILEINRN